MIPFSHRFHSWPFYVAVYTVDLSSTHPGSPTQQNSLKFLARGHRSAKRIGWVRSDSDRGGPSRLPQKKVVSDPPRGVFWVSLGAGRVWSSGGKVVLGRSNKEDDGHPATIHSRTPVTGHRFKRASQKVMTCPPSSNPVTRRNFKELPGQLAMFAGCS